MTGVEIGDLRRKPPPALSDGPAHTHRAIDARGYAHLLAELHARGGASRLTLP